jgi:hypothetical protein
MSKLSSTTQKEQTNPTRTFQHGHLFIMLQRPKNLEIMRKQRKQANRNPVRTQQSSTWCFNKGLPVHHFTTIVTHTQPITKVQDNKLQLGHSMSQSRKSECSSSKST